MSGMLAEDGTRAPARLRASLPRGWRLGWRLAAGGIGTFLVLVALGRMEWLQGAWLADAWRQQRRLVLGMALLQAVAGLLQGVRYHDRGYATTESLVMRSRSGTVRRIAATHDRSKLRSMAGVRFG